MKSFEITILFSRRLMPNFLLVLMVLLLVCANVLQAQVNLEVEGNAKIKGFLTIGDHTPMQAIDARGSNTDSAALLSLGNSDLSHKLLFFPGHDNNPLPFIQWKEGDPLRFAMDEGGFSEKLRIGSDGLIKAYNRITNISDPVEAQDAATKAYVDLLQERILELQLLIGKLEFQTGLKIQDYEGNIYSTVTIGTQMWMAENLRTTKYNEGTDILLVTDSAAWVNLTTPGYCFYDTAGTNYMTYSQDTFGALYNYYTVADTNSLNVCPIGWNVPTDGDWTTLTTYLGGTDVAGGKMKEAGLAHWNSENTGATNERAFSALPGGLRSSSGTFPTIGNNGFWWSSTENGDFTTIAWCRYLTNNNDDVGRFSDNKVSGFSVRCLRDSN